jgi:hypothetical protein
MESHSRQAFLNPLDREEDISFMFSQADNDKLMKSLDHLEDKYGAGEAAKRMLKEMVAKSPCEETFSSPGTSEILVLPDVDYKVLSKGRPDEKCTYRNSISDHFSGLCKSNLCRYLGRCTICTHKRKERPGLLSDGIQASRGLSVTDLIFRKRIEAKQS